MKFDSDESNAPIVGVYFQTQIVTAFGLQSVGVPLSSIEFREGLD